MRKRVLPVVTMLAALVVALPWGFASTASAQTGPITCSFFNGTQNGGTHAVGTTFTVRFAPICPFAPDDVVVVGVNGKAEAEKLSDSDGTVTVKVFVESATRIQLEDPVPAAIRLGDNTLAVAGFSPSANAIVTQTAIFTIVPAATVTATPVRSTTTATPTSKLALTGSNILPLVAVAAWLVAVGTLLVFSRRRRGESFQA